MGTVFFPFLISEFLIPSYKSFGIVNFFWGESWMMMRILFQIEEHLITVYINDEGD